MSRHLGRAIGILALALITAPLAARPLPTDGRADQIDMRPYVRLAITGLLEEYKNPIVKNGIVTDRGTRVDQSRGEYSIGSGTIVTADGLIVTNYHVLEDLLEPSLDYDEAAKTLSRFEPERMLVGVVDATDPLKPVVDQYVATEVAWLKNRDVALVRIVKDARTGEPVTRHDFPYAKLGNPYAIPVLAPLTVFGFPAKGGRSINPSSGPFQGFTFDVANALDGSIKTSAQIAGGNSGGAALYDGRLVAIPTRVSLKTDKGSDFGYLHPITWAAQVFAYASLRYGLSVPALDLAWVESSHNTDVARTTSYGGGHIVSGQSRLPVSGATIVVFRPDRTLAQIRELYQTVEEIRTVMRVQDHLKQGWTVEKTAEEMDLKPEQVRAYRDMKADISSMSPDIQAYDRGDFFYAVEDSGDDGFVFVEFPRGRALSIAILKDGFRDWIGTLEPVTGLSADLGRIQIVMR